VAVALEPRSVATLDVNEVGVLGWSLVRREFDLDMIVVKFDAAVPSLVRTVMTFAKRRSKPPNAASSAVV